MLSWFFNRLKLTVEFYFCKIAKILRLVKKVALFYIRNLFSLFFQQSQTGEFSKINLNLVVMRENIILEI